MRRRESESELAGKLAASLTAPAPHVSRKRPERPARPTGLLHDESTPSEVRIKPLLVVPVVRPVSLYVGRGSSRIGPIALPSLLSEPVHESHRRPGPGAGGAFGVAVAWLAMISIGVLAATGLPAHVVVHAHRPLLVVAPAQAAVAAPAQPAAAGRAGETSGPAMPSDPALPVSFVQAEPAPAVAHAGAPSLPPVSSRSAVTTSAPSRRPLPVRPKAAVPTVREAPSSPDDDDNPYSVAPERPPSRSPAL